MSRLLLCALAAVGLVLAARSYADDAPAAGIDTHRLSEHIRILSSDDFEGRGPGTRGEEKTVAYLIDQFKAMGLQPGGERGSWTQAVTLNRFTVGPVTASLTVGGATSTLMQGDQIVVGGRKPGVAHVAIKDAPLVFVGYGVKAPEQGWDDYKGVDLRGKVAVVLVNDPDFATPAPGRFGGLRMTYYGRWPYKYEELARQGALGVLIVHETAAAGYGWNVVRTSWTAPQFDIPRDARERATMEGWIQGDTAVALFKAAGLDFEAQKRAAQSPDFHPVALAGASFSTDFDVTMQAVVTRNVIARLAGTQKPDDTVLYGAHWDHLGVGVPDATGDRIYNGAADNASGVGGLLELARLYAAAPRPRRSVVFAAWTAEEKGLLGSEYYAVHPLYPLATTVAVMNMDTLPLFGPTKDVVITGGGKGTIEDEAIAIAARQGRTLDPEPRPEAGGYYRSDHFPMAKVGVPALAMGAGPDLVVGGRDAGRAAAMDYTTRRYHQPSDQWRADWDLDGARQDLELFYALGRELADSNTWPEWKPGAEFKPVRDRTAKARR